MKVSSIKISKSLAKQTFSNCLKKFFFNDNVNDIQIPFKIIE